MDARSIHDKVAIVTGGSRGIGRGIAERLGREGAAVIVNYVRAESEALSVVATIRAMQRPGGGSAEAVRADMGSERGAAELFDAAIARFGRVDILVNNAAVYTPGDLSDITPAGFERLFHVNVRGVALALSEAARRMSVGGRVVNISSNLSARPEKGAGRALYSATKASVDALTAAAALELGRRGITVNSVQPGPTVPGIYESVQAEIRHAAAARSPFGRIGTPADIASIVAFLSSDDSAWITGQSILATGGA